jgi:hypothetical protein
LNSLKSTGEVALQREISAIKQNQSAQNIQKSTAPPTIDGGTSSEKGKCPDLAHQRRGEMSSTNQEQIIAARFEISKKIERRENPSRPIGESQTEQSKGLGF